MTLGIDDGDVEFSGLKLPQEMSMVLPRPHSAFSLSSTLAYLKEPFPPGPGIRGKGLGSPLDPKLPHQPRRKFQNELRVKGMGTGQCTERPLNFSNNRIYYLYN